LCSIGERECITGQPITPAMWKRSGCVIRSQFQEGGQWYQKFVAPAAG
jgi:hypothetical protein